MNLRHRHRDAAGQPGQRQQRLQCTRRQVDPAIHDPHGWRPCPALRRPRAEEDRQRQHGADADRADHQMGGPPSVQADHPGDERRPCGAGNVVTRCAECHGDATAFLEPMGDVGDQRREGGGGAEESDQDAVAERELPQAAGQRGEEISQPQAHRADQHGRDDADAIGQLSHHHAARAESDHGQGEWQGRRRAVRAEVPLHRRQGDDDGPHADATQRRQQHRHAKPEPGVARVDFATHQVFSKSILSTTGRPRR